MKPGSGLMLFLILLLVLASCRERNVNRKPQDSSLRLQAASHKDQPAVGSRQSAVGIIAGRPIYAPDTFTYNLPGYAGMDVQRVTSFQQKSLNVGRKNPTLSSRFVEHNDKKVILKAGQTSEDVFFTATWDNDLFDNTDIYYTNGAGFELYHPLISASQFTRLLPGLNYGVNYYGISLIQNLYTPLKLNKSEILTGDRPFAAYLLLGLSRISLSPEKRQRLHTELSLGVIGPGSLGNYSQAMIHSEEPIGWMFQVENDFVANYSFRFDQGLVSIPRFELAVVAGAQAGTLYDNLSAGLFMQFGMANDRYHSIFQSTNHQKPYRKRIRYYFSLDLTNKMIIYDATLQGGMFNDKSIYTISGEDIKRYVFCGNAGFGIGLGKYSLELSQVFLTPEFEGGRHHMWFRIRNIIQLN